MWKITKITEWILCSFNFMLWYGIEETLKNKEVFKSRYSEILWRFKKEIGKWCENQGNSRELLC